MVQALVAATLITTMGTMARSKLVVPVRCESGVPNPPSSACSRRASIPKSPTPFLGPLATRKHAEERIHYHGRDGLHRHTCPPNYLPHIHTRWYDLWLRVMCVENLC